jgi:hypothetical protein
MNLHYAVVSITHISSPYFLSCDIQILLLYACYVVCKFLNVRQLLWYSKRDHCSVRSQDNLKEVRNYPLSFQMKAGVDVLSRTSPILVFLPARHARSPSQLLWQRTVVWRWYEGLIHDTRLKWWTASIGVYLALPLNPRHCFVSFSVDCN